MELYRIFRPITAHPFICSEEYAEWEPCEALKPYIRCFWGTAKPVMKHNTGPGMQDIVTPDTCADIIFEMDFTNNKLHGVFCGIDDRTFYANSGSEEEKLVFTFAIRFYAWTAVLFSEDSMRDTRHAFFDVECHFSRIKRELEPLLYEAQTMAAMIGAAEKVLLKAFCKNRENHLVSEAVGTVLLSKGTMRAEQLAREMHMSERQLQRLFKEYVGISPKTVASLVRYQYLWQDILYNPYFHILDAVHRYGYTDQAHLLHDFKKFHAMNVKEARDYARQNVAFLQD